MSKPPSSSHNLGLEIDGDVQTSNQEFRTYPKPPRYSADFVLSNVMSSPKLLDLTILPRKFLRVAKK
ncbi:hypothetical protein LINGRAHAP2_LOCUS6161 [Linum grandiflorum]